MSPYVYAVSVRLLVSLHLLTAGRGLKFEQNLARGTIKSLETMRSLSIWI